MREWAEGRDAPEAGLEGVCDQPMSLEQDHARPLALSARSKPTHQFDLCVGGRDNRAELELIRQLAERIGLGRRALLAGLPARVHTERQP
eukprot:scaffold220811_cov33-Tisochrysis_lutea.AAC.1